MARQAMAVAQGSTRRDEGRSRPQPGDNALVSSFLREIGPVLGDRNLKGSLTQDRRIAEEYGLSDLGMETLSCLVRAYWVAKDTRKINEKYIDSETRQEYRMPLFNSMFRRFAKAYVEGNWGYTNENLTDDIERDDRLQLWWSEFCNQLGQEQRQSPEEAEAGKPSTDGFPPSFVTKQTGTLPADGSLGHEERGQEVAAASIIDSADLRDFWLYGGAQGLEDAGYRAVDLDGDLFTCQAYEQRRLLLLECLLKSSPLALSPEVEYEVQTYLAWVSQFVCPPEREAELLAHLPPELLLYLRGLEEILDPEQYAVSVRVAPISRRRVIEVSSRNDPSQSWLLRYPQHVHAFIRWWKQARQHSLDTADQHAVVGEEHAESAGGAGATVHM